MKKLTFKRQCNILADRCGVEVAYEGGGKRVPKKKDIKMYCLKFIGEAATFYHHLLLKKTVAAEGRRYLQERDFPEELLSDFQIGFAPNEWDGFMKYAQKKGYSVEQLEAAGLVVPSEKSGKKTYYDRFRNRVMFPICDPLGRVIGFSGRIINKAEKGAKYVNSPETLLFHKSQILFAFDKARKPIVEAHQAIVVEGTNRCNSMSPSGAFQCGGFARNCLDGTTCPTP